MCLFMTVYFPVPVNCVQYLMTFENVHVSFYNEAFHQLVLCCRFFFFSNPIWHRIVRISQEKCPFII